LAITIENCLQAVDEANTCGENLEYDPAFIALEQAIKGKPEQQIGKTVQQEAEPPNWREIKKDSEELLSRTIDLRVLMCYLRALIAMEGLSGLADGLTLIQALVEQRWEGIYPLLDAEDDNDPTERVNVLLTLSDNDMVLRPLSQLALLESKLVGKFNFREISIALGKTTATSTEKVIAQSTIDAAVQDSTVEHLIQTLFALSVSLDTLNQLEKFVTDQVGVTNAPSFAELRHFLRDSKAFLLEWHERRGIRQEEEIVAEEESAEADEQGETEGGSRKSTKSVLGEINNNQDVIKALNLICDYYKKHEPSSPVPIFLERGMRLVGKSFVDVLRDIAPSSIDEIQIFRGSQGEE
jgi:type VI secretion system protein ImpA